MSGRRFTEEEVRALVEDISFPLVVTEEGRIRITNEAWLKQLGYRREEFEGQPAMKFVPPEEQRRIAEAIAAQQGQKDGPPPQLRGAIETVTLTADGARLQTYALSSRVRLMDGRELVLSSCFVSPDLSRDFASAELLVEIATQLHQERTQERVRESAVQGLARAGILATFLDAEELRPLTRPTAPGGFAAEAAREALATGRPVFSGADRERGLRPTAVYLPISPQGAVSELLHLTTDAFLSAHQAVLSLFARQVASALGNARLVQSLEQRNAELKETRQEMVKRERLAALGELSAVVAHEVRNPLGVIFNAVSALRRQAKDEPESRMLLDILAEESDRLNRMVSDLLDFARPAAVSLQPEGLEPLVYEAIAHAGTMTPEGVKVVFDPVVDPALPAVPMDRRLLHQALVNILVNALQAMPRGGRVRVRAFQEDGYLRLDVEDEGVGMAPELLARVFEPFFTTKAQGTGLGLAVVRRIADSHQGDCRAKSTLGVGSCITLRLPLNGAAP